MRKRRKDERRGGAITHLEIHFLRVVFGDGAGWNHDTHTWGREEDRI